MIKKLIQDINNDWNNVLTIESQKNYFNSLSNSLEKREKKIFPPEELIFNIFKTCPIAKIKVVILGQDPYHGEGQANGFSFSVNKGIKTPPSLKNIYKELNNDLSIPIPNHGDLSSWVEQGVFLLNAGLTVDANEANSHLKLGWQTFTDNIIKHISSETKNTVFILWGGFARKKKLMIDHSKHLIIESAHPSPLSAYNGFWDSKPFSKTNDYQLSKGLEQVNWIIK